MDNARLKEAMLDLFSDMRRELDALIDGVNDEEKPARGSVAQWSVKICWRIWHSGQPFQ